MFLKRLSIVLLSFLFVAFKSTGQYVDFLEQYAEEDESAAAVFADAVSALEADPVNINDLDAVATIPFLSSSQIKALRNYIILGGQLYSIDELYAIPGFDSVLVEFLRPLVVAYPLSEPEPPLWQGRSRLVIGTSIPMQHAVGYSNGAFMGDDVHALLHYTYSHKHLSLRFVADKDAKEQWGRDNFYGYHLMLKDIGFVQRLLVGRFSLQFGQGLTLWTGFVPFSVMGSSPVRYAGGVSAASSFSEDGYLEGVAATMKVGRFFSLSPFVSYSDSSLLCGTHVGLRAGNFIAGLTASYFSSADSTPLAPLRYNPDRYHGQPAFAIGADAMWQYGDMLLYGEASFVAQGDVSVIGGANFSSGNDQSLNLSFRHYSSVLNNPYAHPYTSGSQRGESGIRLDFASSLPFSLSAVASIDAYRYSVLRSNRYAPSDGLALKMELSRNIAGRRSLHLRYTHRMQQRNIPDVDTALYIGTDAPRHQVHLEFRAMSHVWQSRTRIVAVRYHDLAVGRQLGFMFWQNLRYERGPLQATLTAAAFSIDGYYSRIYATDSYIQYMWTSSAYYGRGLHTAFLLRYNVNKFLTIAAKYMLTKYFDRTYISSGNNMLLTSCPQNVSLQCRLNF